MSADAKTVNKRTAYVYTGAAILIVVVGLRTLLQTTEEFGTMAFVTIGALIVEFGLLLLYAFTIYTQEVDEKPKVITAQAINLDLNPVIEKIEHQRKTFEVNVEKIVASNQNVIKSLESFTEQTKKIQNENIETLESQLMQTSENILVTISKTDALLSQIQKNGEIISNHSREVKKLGDGIESLVNDQVKLRIQEEIQRVLSSAITAKV